jgi:hypothetical protein
MPIRYDEISHGKKTYFHIGSIAVGVFYWRWSGSYQDKTMELLDWFNPWGFSAYFSTS